MRDEVFSSGHIVKDLIQCSNCLSSFLCWLGNIESDQINSINKTPCVEVYNLKLEQHFYVLILDKTSSPISFWIFLNIKLLLFFPWEIIFEYNCLITIFFLEWKQNFLLFYFILLYLNPFFTKIFLFWFYSKFLESRRIKKYISILKKNTIVIY